MINVLVFVIGIFIAGILSAMGYGWSDWQFSCALIGAGVLIGCLRGRHKR